MQFTVDSVANYTSGCIHCAERSAGVVGDDLAEILDDVLSGQTGNALRQIRSLVTGTTSAPSARSST